MIVAETPTLFSVVSIRYRLQWGRDLIVAETTTRLPRPID